MSLSRAKVLFVTHRVPYPPDKGDRIRTYHILRFVARVADVHLVCLADEPVQDEVTAHLNELCERVAVVPMGAGTWLRAGLSMALGGTATEGAFRSRQLAGRIQEWAEEVAYEAAFASASSVAEYIRVPGLNKAHKVVDLVDVDSQKWYDYAAASGVPKSWLYRLEGSRLRRTERAIHDWADAVTLVSEAEAELFRTQSSAVHGSKIHNVTNGVDLEYFQRSSAEPIGTGCIFVGALDYRPNVDAAIWFATEIWPAIYQKRPETSFRLVGRNPKPAVAQLGQIAGVEVIGQVPDVRRYVAEASVVVAPLRIARGLQNKVVEAMAMGKPVVASAQASAGLGGNPAPPLVIPTSSEEWASEVTQLLEDADTRRELGVEGRRYVEANHDWNECLEPLSRLLGLESRGEAREFSHLACG